MKQPLKIKMVNKLKNNILNYLTLFSSMSTLVCCALPSLLVSLGLGSTLVGLISDFPQLIWISENKVLFFSVSFLLLTGNGLLLWKTRNEPCPLEPTLRASCLLGRKYNKIVHLVSIGLFLTGLSFAFILPSFS